MRTATISEMRNTLSALIDQVREGESIVITDRSRPVARLEPVIGPGDASGDAGRLARLERADGVRRSREEPLDEIFRVPRRESERGGDLLKALLEERLTGR